MVAVSFQDAEDTVEDVDDFLHKIQKNKKGNLGFLHALVASLSVIIVSEIGDKTFFIAAILAMRHSRLTVLLGALSALFVMTIMSGKMRAPGINDTASLILGPHVFK